MQGGYPIDLCAETTVRPCHVRLVSLSIIRCFTPTAARGRKHGRLSSGAGGRGLRGGVGGARGRRGVRCVEGGVREPVAFAAFGHEGRRDDRHPIPPVEESASGEKK